MGNIDYFIVTTIVFIAVVIIIIKSRQRDKELDESGATIAVDEVELSPDKDKEKDDEGKEKDLKKVQKKISLIVLGLVFLFIFFKLNSSLNKNFMTAPLLIILYIPLMLLSNKFKNKNYNKKQLINRKNNLMARVIMALLLLIGMAIYFIFRINEFFN